MANFLEPVMDMRENEWKKLVRYHARVRHVLVQLVSPLYN